MFRTEGFRHLGGGRKGLFLLLRYLFIVAAAYLLIFESTERSVSVTHGLMIAVALASNVGLSLAPEPLIFAWYVEAPVLIADTLWVSWALQSTGASGQEFFLLYFFVLFLAALGENLLMVLLGSTLVSVANVYFITDGALWTSPHLLRVAFFYTVALFYGHVISEIKRERQRADKGFAWAKELEATVAERTAQLSRLYSASVAANRLKSEFLANMSHELRTPLGIIIGYADMLLDPHLSAGEPERCEMLRRIAAAARQQAHLVDHVLDIGRLEAGKMPVEMQPILLDRFIADLQERMHAPLADGVSMTWQTSPRLPLIETDPEKLATIVAHLVDNAIKFTPVGRITVRVDDQPAEQRVVVRVEDTGAGIAEADRQTIFEAFRQFDGASGGRPGGVGLGLAIVQGYVKLIGGEISVDSALGRGSSFAVTLPYRPLPTPSAYAPPDGLRHAERKVA